MRKILPVFLLFLCILPARAHAQDVHGINILNFKMSSDPTGLITSESARRLEHLQWYVGGMFSYAYDPLYFEIEGDKNSAVVEHQLLMDLTFSVGIWKYFQLGAQMQAVMYQTGDDPADLGFASGTQLKAMALADFRLLPKIVLLQPKGPGLGLAFVPILSLPTATATANAGEDGPTFEPRLIIDYRLRSGALIVGQAGYRWRKGAEVANLRVDDEIVFSFGAEVPLLRRISLIGEVFGGVGLKDAGSDADSGIDLEEVPAEGLIAARLRHETGLIVTGGVGTGLTPGYGSPRVRVFVSAGYSPSVKPMVAPRDTDGDGIPDDADACVNDPEDKNGFEDRDGCPDANKDTDGDGIFDPSDKCPKEPEDKNNFEDTDGCPDANRDTDKDGILDPADKCPADPEDKDGFEDTDGCPDADNDGDGFCDPNPDVQANLPKYEAVCKGSDKCPNEKEIINGVDDGDGCPDKGAEKVQITKSGIIVLDKIFFETSKATLLRQSFPILDMVVSVMKTHTHIELIEIQGHTDDVGDDDKNLRLSDARANTVMKYLVSKGIDAKRLTARGFGETVPIEACSALKRKALSDCRGKNRRVEFKILRMGKAKGE